MCFLIASMKVRSSGHLLLLALFVCGLVQASANAEEDLGFANVAHEHVSWPNPEDLLRNLHSTNEQARTSAFPLMGIADQGMPDGIPQRVDLLYALIGGGPDQQAIVTVSDGQYAWGAVAVVNKGKWIRIASFSCWCKYDLDAVPGSFVQIQLGAEARAELVIHASGGGSGIYSQDEAHFRIVNGELQSVLHFVSRERNCSPNAAGSTTRRLIRAGSHSPRRTVYWSKLMRAMPPPRKSISRFETWS